MAHGPAFKGQLHEEKSDLAGSFVCPHVAWQMLAKGYRNRHVGETAMNRSVIP